MKRATLHLVADNTVVRPTGARAAAAVDYAALAARARYWAAMALLIIGAPFRFVRAVCRAVVATGRGFMRGIVSLALGTIGLALIVCVGYGLLRVLLHPLFR